MSRTYRCRHFPALPGHAAKIVDGCGRFRWDDRRAALKPQVDALLGPPDSDSLYRASDYKTRMALYDALEDTVIWPVGQWHPWQRTPPAGSAKLFHRVLANRMMRRRTRAILNTAEVNDDWTGHFPDASECFDWWSVY
jgi:hypothetical protein